MPFAKKIGDMGERIARYYLEKKKYKIIDLNYRKKWGEIDIIGESKQNSLVFFEVKTRTLVNGKYGLAEESINNYKQRRLLKTAETFLFENKYNPMETNWQFDVLIIIINVNAKTARIRHIENAFSGN